RTPPARTRSRQAASFGFRISNFGFGNAAGLTRRPAPEQRRRRGIGRYLFSLPDLDAGNLLVFRRHNDARAGLEILEGVLGHRVLLVVAVDDGDLEVLRDLERDVLGVLALLLGGNGQLAVLVFLELTTRLLGVRLDGLGR